MVTVRDIQIRLNELGFGPLKEDNVIGAKTLLAIREALATVVVSVEPVPPNLDTIVPASWMPKADMKRIIFHWTAGSNKASQTDREHYHILIEGDGNLVRGDPTIDMNESPLSQGYAAHTFNCNSGSIGVSLCGMAGAQEHPFFPGKSPITAVQWKTLAQVLRDLSIRYKIAVTPKTILSHAEVQQTLGIKQKGKWDIARLPFKLSLIGGVPVGNEMRAMVKGLL